MTQQNTNRSVVRIKTALQRQRRMVIYLLIAVAILGVALGLTLFFTSRTAFIDPTDGIKYYIAKKGDIYVMQTTDGEILPTTSEGNYVTSAGTIVYVDDDTGEFSTVAAVLIEDGETVKFDAYDGKYDVLLYPLLERDNIAAIEVHNKNGSFRFLRQDIMQGDELVDTEFLIEDREDLAVDESVLFATLVYFTGRTQTMLRLDTNRVKELGYAEYGLPEDVKDAAQYFIISAMDGTSHKVIIGDEIPSGDGYFVRYANRDAVYVLSELTKSEYNGTFKEALLGRVEDYVTPPSISYAMESTTYFDVSDFKLYKNGSSKPIIGFSYSGSIDKRNNTYYSNIPYTTDINLSGYTVNSYTVDDCLYALYTWEPDFVVALGSGDTMGDIDTNEWLKPYGLDTESYAYQFSFFFNRVRTYNKETGKDVVKRADQEKHIVLVSEKQEDGYYYVYNLCYEYDDKTKDFTILADGYNMIVAIDESQLNFLFFTQKDWISADLFSGSISYLEEMSIKVAPGMLSQYPAGYQQTFTLDNSETLKYLAENPEASSQLSTDKMVVRDSAGKVLNTMQIKHFYQSLLYTACPDYSALSQAQKQAHIASGTEGAALVIKLKYVLRELNEKTGYYEETGEVIVREYCFYENLSTPLQFFTTVNGTGDFYLPTSRIKKVLNDISKLYATPETDRIYYDSLT
ncbi:MAG: hypothetical protein IKM42_00135 [Clostridia bacterium]|nr:hypothetical protein [Clostridia bacterium]